MTRSDFVLSLDFEVLWGVRDPWKRPDAFNAVSMVSPSC